MPRVFLIHGWDGNPRSHWFPWLKMELVARGFEVSAPQLPHAAEPKVKEWLDFLRDYVGKPDSETFFVGHSLGCITIARYLEGLNSPFVKGSTEPFSERAREGFKSSVSLPTLQEQAGKNRPPSFSKGGIKVGGCVFVAGFSGRLNIPEIREFYSLPFDPEKAKAHCGKFVMIFSDNDPYVPMEKSLEMARQLGAKTILERGKKHFIAADGVTALPSALSALLKIASAERA